METRADLARELTALRSRSGLTVRELARRVGTPTATIGGYFSGRHLPGTAQLGLFRELLRQCGVAGGDEVESWVDALSRVRLSSDGRVVRPPAPYRGLEPFQSEDASLFFGREDVVEEVMLRLAAMREQAAEGGGPLLVVGPSGSGKSSLLAAGVVPRVRSGELSSDGAPWSVATVVPGDAPLAALRACVSELGAAPRLVVVDQFEDVLAASQDERASFLAEVAGLGSRDTLVVAVLRADFYEVAAAEPTLLRALRSAPVLLGPPSEEQLRRVVLEPARRAGVSVEDGLVDLLLADLSPGGPGGLARESGALPFLSYALLSTWERAKRNRLGVADYRAAGGVGGAIRQRAEELYTALDPVEQELARRMFLRLVPVEEDSPLTRRRVPLGELEELAAGASDGVAGVLDRFVAARLVTADAKAVEVSHDALLVAWPRLAEWIEADREGLRVRHQLTDAANAWSAGGRDPSLLLRGTRLQLARDWVGEPRHVGDLNRVEREFLDSGIAEAAAEQRATRRRARRAKQLLGAVALFAAAAVVLASVAFVAQREAVQARNDALSRQVATEASGLEPTDPALAMQLALVAYRTAPTVQATSTLLDASAFEMPTRVLGPPGPSTIATGARGTLLAVARSAADSVAMYSVARRVPVHLSTVVLGTRASEVFAVALSPDGRLLAAGGTAGVVTLWAVEGHARPVRVETLHGFTSTVYGLAFAPGGRRLAAADDDGSVRVWSLSPSGHASLLRTLLSPGRDPVHAVAFSPDGRLLVAAAAGGELLEWGRGRSAPVVTHSGSGVLTSLAFSPDGRTLALGSEDDLIRVLSVATDGAIRAERPPLSGFTSWVDSLAFSPDGRYLVAGGSDNSLRVFSTTGWAEVATLGHPAPVTGVGFEAGGRRLVSSDGDGTVRVWSFPPPSTYVTPGSVYTVDYTANGRELAAVSGGSAGDVTLYDVSDAARPVEAGSVTMPAAFGPVAGVESLSPGGRLLAVGNARAEVRLVRLADPGHPTLVGPVIRGATPSIEQLNFSPGMKVLSVGDDAGRVHLFDVSRPAHPRLLATLRATSNVLGVAFSPDGHLLAAASADDEIWLYDVADPSRPRRLAVLGGFTSYAYGVAFTPDGRTLVGSSADGTVRLWDVSDPARPRLLGSPLSGPGSTVYWVAVSPDGKTLAASTTSGEVWLWNIADPARPVLVADLTAATGEVFDVAFSPNGTTLVAGGSDATLTFFDYHPGQVAARICAVAGSPVTRSEWAQYVQGAPYGPPCG
ncbi:MAG: helix-turn-helix domain-containing protein [Actinomycetota bacterium]|nr:helix-turn-helix domain-containing protein [Actinomycetota bacterium]